MPTTEYHENEYEDVKLACVLNGRKPIFISIIYK